MPKKEAKRVWHIDNGGEVCCIIPYVKNVCMMAKKYALYLPFTTV